LEATEEIRKSIVVDAPPERVYKAPTDEKELVHWMPQAAKMDARVGGQYEFKYHWGDRNLETVLKGKILELEPNKKLSYSWDSQTMDRTPRISSSVVTWILDGLPDGKTRVTVIQAGIAKQFSKDADSGWNYFLGRLANYCKA